MLKAYRFMYYMSIIYTLMILIMSTYELVIGNYNVIPQHIIAGIIGVISISLYKERM